jgi:hypothetical protein
LISITEKNSNTELFAQIMQKKKLKNYNIVPVTVKGINDEQTQAN